MSISGNWDGRRISRRAFVGWAGVGTGSLALYASGYSSASAWAKPFFERQPFSLGVASGDPTPRGVVLWTRLAPDPLEVGGGMPERKVPVKYEIAIDEGFRRAVKKGTTFATPELAHSVHIEVEGLLPGREYFYRFKTGSEQSPVGQTRTAPTPNADLQELRFAFVSCQNYPEGYLTAYRHIAAEDLDLVVHLGDYIYEGNAQGNIGRGHVPAGEIFTLSDYRRRYAQYKGDEDLRAAHARHPFVVTLDDHDVENNWAGEVSQADSEPDQDPQVFLQRRAAAFQACYEHLPLRVGSKPNGPDMQLYRRFSYGNLAQLDVLDGRQYRRDQACGDGRRIDCEERLDPSRTMLGDEQERWLLDGLASSGATWKVVANQVFMMQADHQYGPEQAFGMDTWDGYAAARERLLAGVAEAAWRTSSSAAGTHTAAWPQSLRRTSMTPTRRPWASSSSAPP